jgi:hypothetical protein
VSASTNAAVTVGPGVHRICATTRLINFIAGESYRIDDSSLIVMD